MEKELSENTMIPQSIITIIKSYLPKCIFWIGGVNQSPEWFDVRYEGRDVMWYEGDNNKYKCQSSVFMLNINDQEGNRKWMEQRKMKLPRRCFDSCAAIVDSRYVWVTCGKKSIQSAGTREVWRYDLKQEEGRKGGGEVGKWKLQPHTIHVYDSHELLPVSFSGQLGSCRILQIRYC